ncbi:MAG: type II toxin-antitoxin system prevent-host-death family antitoxin [Sporichthyaceae bacterium]
MSDLLVPITEAKARLSEIVRESEDRNVLLMKHGRPGAVVISSARYEELMSQIEDMSDRLSIYERDGVTIGLDKLTAELGLAGEV